MKNIFCLLFICLVIMQGCKKETPPPVIPVEPTHLTDLGTIAFKRNGINLTMKGNLYLLPGETFQIISIYRKILQTPSLEETISMSRIPYKLGKNKFYYHQFSNGIAGIPTGRLDWTIELDQPVAHLRSTDLYPDDFIEVIEIDTIAKTVEGRFQLHLNNVQSFDLSEFNLPDSVYIKEGAFYLKTE